MQRQNWLMAQKERAGVPGEERVAVGRGWKTDLEMQDSQKVWPQDRTRGRRP